MALKISDMTPITESTAGKIVDEDMFEMSQATTNKTYRATAKNIADYFMKDGTNGGFRGVTNRSPLNIGEDDGWSLTDMGVWWFAVGGQDDPITITDAYSNAQSFRQCILEIITYKKPDENPGYFMQRVSSQNCAFQRLVNAESRTATPWLRMDSHSSMIMDCGYSASLHVDFTVEFPNVGDTNNVPIVTVTPLVGTNSAGIVIVPQIVEVTRTGFTVSLCKSNTITQITETTTTVNTTTTGGDENGTKNVVEETKVVEQGAKWEWVEDGANECRFHWQAIMYPGALPSA